jgi:hydroxymethylbilane synthase
MLSRTIRIATRKSPLALWQADFVREQLLQYWPDLVIELLPMSTSGDRFLKDKLLTIGGKGLFVKELEEALLDKRADLAVHSMKDVPVAFPDGLSLAVICQRDNPMDAFVSNQYALLEDLPRGATVGTSSLRRQSQLLAHRPDLVVKPLRGNIHTRLEKMDSGEFDAIILAAAGLERMGMQSRIREYLATETMLPACGQGALGIECRTNDEDILALLQPLNHSLTALCVHTERRVNALLGGNCHTPLAVYCKPLNENHLLLSAKVASADGQRVIHYVQQDSQQVANELAQHAVMTLLADGAGILLGEGSN